MTRHGLDAPTELTGGAWEPDRRGVLRWVDATPAPEPEPRLLVACPSCRALIHERCRTRNGNPRPVHSARILPRRCPCGEVIPNRRKQKWCADCKVEARRIQQRRADSRRRELKREYDRMRRGAAA